MNYKLKASLYYCGKKEEIVAGDRLLGDKLLVTLDDKKLSSCAEFLTLRMKNISDSNTEQITCPRTLELFVPSTKKPRYHGLRGDDCGYSSFTPMEFTVEKHYHEEPTGGRSADTSGFPYFDVTTEEGALGFAIGWTGQWSKDIYVTEGGFSVQIGLCYSDFYLKPGEEIRLPSVLITQAETAPLARRAIRNTVREYFSPKRYLGEKMYIPTAIQCFDRYFYESKDLPDIDARWNSVKGQIRTVNAAKKIGHFDTLWLDAAWFAEGFPNGVGNFRFNDGFPEGLREVSEYAHQNGMKFVLWFEPERVHEGSDTYTKEEFLLQWQGNPRDRLYNLADDKAWEWLKNTLVTMIRDNGIDVYRQDFNFRPLPYWLESDEENRTGMTEIKYVMGLYRLWDTLLEEFPDLLIDNCASGGRRLDLEMAMRSVTLWRSDTGCNPESEKRRVTAWSQNQIMTLSEYLPYHACATWEPRTYDIRSTATQGMACTFDILNDDFDFVQAEKIMAEVRELAHFWDGDFYPLTPFGREHGKWGDIADEKIWTAYQLAKENEGVVYAFRREFCEIPEQTLALKAIDPEARYLVTWIDEAFVRTEKEVRGNELAEGILVSIPEKRQSCVMKYRKL